MRTILALLTCLIIANGCERKPDAVPTLADAIRARSTAEPNWLPFVTNQAAHKITLTWTDGTSCTMEYANMRAGAGVEWTRDEWQAVMIAALAREVRDLRAEVESLQRPRALVSSLPPR